MYDKCGIVLRIETTTNDDVLLQAPPKGGAQHRNGPPTRGIAPLKENHLQPDRPARDTGWLQPALSLAHLSALDDFSAGVRALGRLTKPHEVDGKTVKGINFFEPGDSALLHALQNPSVNIAGIRRGRAASAEPGNVLARSAVTTTTPAALTSRWGDQAASKARIATT